MASQTNFPIIKPTLNLDFANTKRLDPRITYTNASDNRTYFDEFGVMRKAAANVPRFDHDPVTGESLGLLIEEKRTNLLTYSEQFDNAAWEKVSTTITANAETAPDGTVTMDKFIATSSGGISYRLVRQHGTAVTSGLVYCYSVYVKAGEESVVTIRFETTNSAFTFAFATFDLSSGTVSSNTAESAGIEYIGNGIYRVWATKTATATANGRAQIQLRNFTYVGDDVSGLYIWGAQLEAGSFPTSYIKTEASQKTRAADSAVMTGTNFSSWYNPKEGTLYAEADTADVASSRVTFYIHDGTTANRIHISAHTGLKAYAASGGVTQTSQGIAEAVFANNTPSKVALAYALNNANAAANGILGTLDNTFTVPTVNQVRLGGISTSNSPLNGHIKRLTYYPRRLSDPQQQAITA